MMTVDDDVMGDVVRDAAVVVVVVVAVGVGVETVKKRWHLSECGRH